MPRIVNQNQQIFFLYFERSKHIFFGKISDFYRINFNQMRAKGDVSLPLA